MNAFALNKLRVALNGYRATITLSLRNTVLSTLRAVASHRWLALLVVYCATRRPAKALLRAFFSEQRLLAVRVSIMPPKAAYGYSPSVSVGRKTTLTVVVIEAALALLGFLGRSRVVGAKASVQSVIALMPISDMKKDRIYDLVFEGIEDGARVVGPWHGPIRIFNTDFLSSDSGPTQAILDASLATLFGASELHVFLESKARLPGFLQDSRLQHCRFVIHAMHDIERDIESMGLTDRVVVRSLREAFPDISPEAESLHRFARRLSQVLVSRVFGKSTTRLKDALPLSASARVDVLAQGLEDDLAWQLSLLECFRHAMAGVTNAPRILVASSDRVVPGGLPLLSAALESESFYLSTTLVSRRRLRQFWNNVAAAVAQSKHARPSLAKSDIGVAKPSSVPIPNAAGDSKELLEFQEAVVRSYDVGRRDGARLRAAIPAGRAAELIIFAPVSAAYSEVLNELTKEVAGTPGRVPIVLNCVVSRGAAVPSQLSNGATTVFDLAGFVSLLTRRQKRKSRLGVERYLSSTNGIDFAYDGVDVRKFLLPYILEFLDGKLSLAVAAYGLGGALAPLSRLRGAYTLPGRHWLVRAVAAGFVDQVSRGPVVDIQALNVLAHAKYLAPVSDLATVIDSTSARIYEEALGFPADRIRVTGTPRNDAIRDEIRLMDRAAAARRIGADPNGRERVFLASQLQPFERMADIVRPVAKLMNDRPDTDFVIKLHPREGEGRRQAYESLLSELGIAHRTVIAGKVDPKDVIAASDVCLTIYSNMAREAALAGREVLVALHTGWEPPIRLDLEGLGQGASDENDFIELLRTTLNSRARTDSVVTETSLVNQYFEQNPHLMEGFATNRIRGVFEAAVEAHQRVSSDLSCIIDARPEDIPEAIAGYLNGSNTVHVVLQDGIGVAQVPPIFPTDGNVIIYSNSPGKRGEFVPVRATVISGAFNEDNRETIEAAVERANSQTWRLCETLVGALAGSDAGRELGELKEALWLRLRPPIIEAERSRAHLLRALDGAPDALLIIGASTSFLHDFSASHSGPRPNKEVSLLLEDNGTLSVHQTAAPTSPQVDSPMASSPQMFRAPPALRAELDNWIRYLRPAFDSAGTPQVVLTTAWNLKTVPSTLCPVVDKLPKDTHYVAFNFSNANLSELTEAVMRAKPRTKPTVIGPAALAGTFAKPPKALLRDLRRCLLDAIKADLSHANVSSASHAVALATIDGFVKSGLWEMLAWNAHCRGMFANPRTISVACPGRQWHTEVAHIRAAQAGRCSVTIQNAYMTRGYTYTRPTGDVVTAIDTWSRDVLAADYKVPLESILVASTPRFDYLSAMRSGDREQACATLDVVPTDYIILYAAQEGLEAEARRVLNALASVRESAQPITVLVKLHPRSSDEVLVDLRDWATQLRGNHKLIVERSWPIEVTLAACDLVITAYSNVGIEAAILGKPVLVSHFGTEDLPLPLDQLGIGFVARTEAALSEFVFTLQNDAECSSECTAIQQAYFDANPVMRTGRSAEVIADRIKAGIDAAPDFSADVV